ncbi:MAG: DUF86 domain-containing protein [Caldilineaceae bacterium]
MSAVNVDRIRELLGNIADAQRQLAELGAESLADFLADFRNVASAKYLLIVANEAAIDICNHIVARQGGRAPDAYAECFEILSTLGVIDNDLANKLQQMARFRNLLVHLYWQVDNQRIHEIIRDDLVDLDDFRHQVAKWSMNL